MSRRGGRRDGGKPTEEQRTVRISKTLSSTLRHRAKDEGLHISNDGYVNVADLMALPKYKSLQLDLDALKEVVRDNNKQRFKLIRRIPKDAGSNPPLLSEASTATSSEASASSDPTTINVDEDDNDPNPDPKNYFIRATQGHSIALESELILTPITTSNLPPVCIHGTFYPALTKIIDSGHLSRMTRTHMHFAPGLPKESINPKTGETVPAVVSGMRFDAEVLLYIDIEKALADGIPFWRSDNGVILTAGEGETGKLPLEYVEKVEDFKGAAGGGDIWTSSEGVIRTWPEKSIGIGKGGGRGGGGRGRGRGRGSGKPRVMVDDEVGEGMRELSI